MTQAWDFAALAEKIKTEGGLDVAEDGAKLIFNKVCDWISESVVLSENKVDDVIAPLMLAIKPIALSYLDKLDGKEG